MMIQNSNLNDKEEIFKLYELATNFQKERYTVHWPIFKDSLIESEIKQNRQWKLVIDGQIACIWATTFSDPQIWQEKNSDPAVYIHRIATHPNFRGRQLVQHIVNWAKDYASANDKAYIRMDTVGENTSLITYYQRCGFAFLGLSKLNDTEGLPMHYDNAIVSLFEISL
ncbi:GNAT family N-acetyltransferase [Myroides sp. LoEW2-1]|uniref:GNAT family N-acetyltransferase n=1 Tax=Myroides sp. LoEW2-1 TaxID=2683192 RepID=UPI00132547F7|nr:GNAT family N-acetyltransferase [Myroides sp. LoEW2-1]MVX34396.1 GNAT family N-acetyltransferase [Myroides sp. LoEW2-1]